MTLTFEKAGYSSHIHTRRWRNKFRSRWTSAGYAAADEDELRSSDVTVVRMSLVTADIGLRGVM